MIKGYIKKCLYIICTVMICPLFFLYLMINNVFPGDRFFWATSQFLSLLPGVTGSYIRRSFYALTMAHCSRNGTILFGTIFSHKDTVIRDHVYIGPQCNIGKCTIAEHCTIGSGVHILSGNAQHGHEDLEIPIQDQTGIYKNIIIGEDTWIGNCAVILANIGKKCIIGAGTVVVNDVEDYSVVVGNPGKVIRKRSPLKKAF